MDREHKLSIHRRGTPETQSTEKCLLSLLITEIQIKIIIKNHSHSPDLRKFMSANANVSKDTLNHRASFTAGGTVS